MAPQKKRWIQKATASMEKRGTKGSLRKALHKKPGETITEEELERAAKRPGLKKKVAFAKAMRKIRR